MTEQTEWRHGDVVVKRYDSEHWGVRITDDGRLQRVPLVLFPDPRPLEEFVDSQRPRPRYSVMNEDSLGFVVWDHRRDGSALIVNVRDSDMDGRFIAAHLADWLNEQDAQ